MKDKAFEMLERLKQIAEEIEDQEKIEIIDYISETIYKYEDMKDS